MWPHTVAILIGGQSKRMRTPKQHVKLPNGETMLEAMLSFAKETAKSTVVVGGEVEGLQSIHDRRNKGGPVAGIEALLHSGLDDRYLVVGCDMPMLQIKDVQPLLEFRRTAVFQSKNQLQPLPLLIHTEELERCTTYLNSGKKSLLGFIESTVYESIEIDLTNNPILTNINSPEDLSRLFDLA